MIFKFLRKDYYREKNKTILIKFGISHDKLKESSRRHHLH